MSNIVRESKLGGTLDSYVKSLGELTAKDIDKLVNEFNNVSGSYLIYIEGGDESVVCSDSGIMRFNLRGIISNNPGSFKSLTEQYERLLNYDVGNELRLRWRLRLQTLITKFIVDGASSFDTESILKFGFVDMESELRYSEIAEIKEIAEDFKKAAYILNKNLYSNYLIVYEE